MPDSTKRLIVKSIISTTEWKQAVAQIKAQLKEVADQAKQQQAAQLADQKKSIDLTKQQVQDQKLLSQQAKAMADFDKAKAAWQQQQAAARKTLLAQTQLETAEAKKQAIEQTSLVNLEKQKVALKTAELKLEQQQAKAASQHAAAAGGSTFAHGATSGLVGRSISALGKGFFGGGLTGGLAAGVAAGELFHDMLEKIGEGLRDIGKELVQATDKTAQLREQFNKLAARDGKDPSQLLQQMRVATRGLVSDFDLLKLSNQFMAGSMKLSSAQMTQLTQLTVDLARATGKDATEAVQALQRAALTGRTQVLAMVTGIDRAQLQMKGLPATMDPVIKKHLELSNVMSAMARKFAEVGTPMTTLGELMRQVDNTEKAFVEETAFAIVHSDGFRTSIADLSKWVMKITPDILHFGEVLGSKVGDGFMLVKAAAKAAGSALDLFVAGAKVIDAAVEPLLKLFGILDKGDEEAVTWRKWIGGLTILFQQAGLSIETYAIKTTAALTAVKLALKGHFAEAKKILDQANVDVMMATMKASLEMAKTADFIAGKEEAPEKAGATKKVPVDRTAINKQLAQLELQIAKDKFKQLFELRMQELQEEEEATKASYDAGEMKFKTYLDRLGVIYEQQRKAKILQVQQDRDAQLQELKMTAAGVKDPTTGQMVSTEDPSITAKKRQQIVEKANAEIAAINKESAKQQSGLVKQALNDEIAARKAYIDALSKMEKEGVAERTKALEDEFKQGKVSVTQYLADRKALIEEEFQVESAALQEKANAAKKNDAELATIRIAQVELEIKREKDLTELIRQEGQLRIQALEQGYNAAKEILTTQLDTAELKGGTDPVAMRALQDITQKYLQELQNEQQRLVDSGAAYGKQWLEVTKNINGALQEQKKLNEQIARSKDFAGPLASIFGTLSQSLGKILGPGAKSTLDNLTKSLEMLSKVSTGIAAQSGGMGGLFKATGSSFLNLFRKSSVDSTGPKTAEEAFKKGLTDAAGQAGGFGKVMSSTSQMTSTSFTNMGSTVKSFGGTITGAQHKMMEFAAAAQAAINRMNQTGGSPISTSGGDDSAPTSDSGVFGTVPGTSGDLSSGSQLSQIFNDLIQSGSNLKQQQDDQSESTGNFGDKLSSFVENIKGTIQAVMSVVSSIAGAKSTGGGIMSGGLSGLSFGAKFGPIGAAIGGIGGAVLGGIVGHKQQQAQKMADQIKKNFDDTVKQLQDGTLKLGDAIKQLQAQRQAAVNQLGGSKKGRKQLPAILAQFDAELQTLQAQQKKKLDELHNSLLELQQPLDMQPLIGSIDQIVQKYKDFVDAASGNAAEMTKANQWLTLSLQQYAQTLNDQVAQAQMDAIQNAIQLNDLMQQRNDLIQQETDLKAQEKQQEYGIMSEGVLSRQQSNAQTKLQRINDLRTQTNQQLAQMEKQKEQMDEEIALAQYKYDNEKKIFGLATTRIDLESQLLGLQEKQSDQELAKIQALQQVISMIGSNTANGISPSILALLQGSNSMQGILDLLSPQQTGPLPPTPPRFLPHPPGRPLPGPGPRQGPGGFGGGFQGADMFSTTATLAAQKQVSIIVGQRVQLESALLDRQRQQTMLEMSRMEQMSTLMNQMAQANYGVVSLEGAMSKIYELRGRYGSGGFTRENL